MTILKRVRTQAAEEDWSDAELVKSAIAGNRDAIAVIYLRHSPDVYRFVRRMGHTRAAAEDVLHDVFVATLNDLGRYDPSRAKLVHYLFGIARNVIRSRARRFWMREVLVGDVPEQSEDTDPLANRAQAERIAAVRSALARLPLRYREVLVLCDMQEVNYASAAEVLKLPVGTVRSRLHRGRRLLSERLTRAEGVVGAKRWSWRTEW